jgi:hypothetical protein
MSWARKLRKQAARDERFRAATTWAKDAPVAVRPLSTTLLEDARRRYTFRGDADILAEKGLHAYCRHYLTNYDELRKQWDGTDVCSAVQGVLRQRADEAVTAALLERRNMETQMIQVRLPSSPKPYTYRTTLRPPCGCNLSPRDFFPHGKEGSPASSVTLLG